MASKPPVTPLSAHRLFPAMVAIWFAALFGLGCAVLPASVIEGVVTATGLPKILPAAAPPLGFTAQASLALAAAVFGGVCGFLLAGKVAALQGAVRPAHADIGHSTAPRRREKPGARRPLSIKDELDDEPLFSSSFAADEPLAGRRRSLMPAAEALTPEPEAPFADEPEYGPLPVDEPVSFKFDEALPTDFGYPEPEQEAEAEIPSSTVEFAAEEPPFVESEAEPETLATAPQAQGSILPTDPRADLGGMGIVQLTERLGHALQGRLDRGQLRPVAPPPALLAELAGLPPRPAAPERQPAPEYQPASPQAFAPEPVLSPEPSPDAPEALLAAEFTPSPFAEQGFALDEIDPQEAIFGVADIESAPPRSATFAPSMTEALRSAALQLDEFGEDEEEGDDESDVAEEQYGSLLAIKNLTGEHRSTFSDSDDEDGYADQSEDSYPFETQPLPAHSDVQADTLASAQGETEDETEALRRALAQLQRMSGAA